LAKLMELPVEAREEILVTAATERWARKVRVAGRRMEETDPCEAIHRILLETLGLKRNRAVMCQLAMVFPLERWRSAPRETASLSFETFRDDWRLAGLRPANHPSRRLNAYAEWIARGKELPLKELFSRPPHFQMGSKVRSSRISRWRKESGVLRKEEEWREVFAPAVGGTRFHTWVGDGLLPLLAAKFTEENYFGCWFIWPIGDVPERLKRALKTLEIIGPGRPLCNGWIQGIIRMLEPDYRGPNE